MRDTITLTCMMILLVSFFFVRPCVASNESDAKRNMDQAEHDLALAYGDVAEAAAAGADIRQLSDKLNAAADLLARANNTFRIGDYENATAYALECTQTLVGVAENATTLRIQTEAAFKDHLLFTAVLSSVGLAILASLGVAFWRFLKTRYLKRILESKPEVQKTE